MKLPIKDKFFREIKEGKKSFEIRDAHITFVNEDTKEELRKNIMAAGVGTKRKVLDMAGLKEEEVKDCIEDESLIYFYLE